MNVTEVTLRYVWHDDDVDRYLRLPLLKGWIDKVGFDSHRGPRADGRRRALNLSISLNTIG